MFHDRVRALIERQYEALKLDASVLGQRLADCNPYQGEVDVADLGDLVTLCQAVGNRGDTLGVEGIAQAAGELDRQLGVIAAQSTVEPWELVRLMELQALLASAVDELEAEHSAFFCACTTPEALTVAPLPDQTND